MSEHIFTFGFGCSLANCFVAIEAESAGAAREKMFEVYGPRWAFQYESREAAGVERFGLREVPLGAPVEYEVQP